MNAIKTAIIYFGTFIALGAVAKFLMRRIDFENRAAPDRADESAERRRPERRDLIS